MGFSMTRNEAISYLHKSGYSRRMSAKLVDIALLNKESNSFSIAIKDAVIKATGVIEKARKIGSRDIKKRKARSKGAKMLGVSGGYSYFDSLGNKVSKEAYNKLPGKLSRQKGIESLRVGSKERSKYLKGKKK